MKFKVRSIFKMSLGLSLLSLSHQASAVSVDEYLRQKLEFFGVDEYKSIPVDNSPAYTTKVELGRKLFVDTNLSGNKNISCMTCHNPMKGTSDGLALSQTEDGKGVLRRNSSSLYNVGDEFNSFMFWDGRVQFVKGPNVFLTPEPAFNGKNPPASHITSVLHSALAAQALFPLVSIEEMKGRKGDNEIADAKDNLEAWDLIIKRITKDKKSDAQTYVNLFNRAFPETKGEVQKINIGHAGEAMATFMRDYFQSNSSPFHRYLAGDKSAMTIEQKRGLAVFIDAGCIACHQGNLLGNNSFFASVGVPTFGAKPFSPDRGRGEIDAPNRNFFFKTPSLINVGLSAPYMHNGAFKTIREVLEHYNDIKPSLSAFDISHRTTEFPVAVEVLNSPNDLNDIWKSIQAGFLRNGLHLVKTDLDDLEAFLMYGLTDPKWVPQKNN